MNYSQNLQNSHKDEIIDRVNSIYNLWMVNRSNETKNYFSRYRRERTEVTDYDQLMRMVDLIASKKDEFTTCVLYLNRKKGRRPTDPDFNLFPANIPLIKIKGTKFPWPMEFHPSVSEESRDLVRQLLARSVFS